MAWHSVLTDGFFLGFFPCEGVYLQTDLFFLGFLPCGFSVLTDRFFLGFLPCGGRVEYFAGERSSGGDIGGALATDLKIIYVRLKFKTMAP